MKKSDCPHDPKLTHGAIGMYHCPECGEMQVAGINHTGIMEDEDWDKMDAMNKKGEEEQTLMPQRELREAMDFY